MHLLDNECSDLLKSSFSKHNIAFQRVLPHTHRRNAAKRAIQTWKNHFLSGLATCDPDYPATEWDRLMPQCDLTRNLLRSYRRQPKLSSHTRIFGNHDFNRNPLDPPFDQISGPQKKRSMQKLGTTRHHWMVHRLLHRTLPVPQMLYPSNQRSPQLTDCRMTPQENPIPQNDYQRLPLPDSIQYARNPLVKR